MIQKKQNGFTLIELMIAVAVIGILLAIAIPNYQEYLRKAARSAGQTYLSDLAQRQELRFQDARTYSDQATDFPTMPPDVALRYSAPTFAKTDFDPGPPPEPASFTITMVPSAGLLATDGTLTINNLGVRKRGTFDW